MRSVKELKSLKEIGLSKKTLYYINSKKKSINELVKECRDYSYYSSWGQPRKAVWKDELIKILDEAGFIRHDIDPMSFKVAQFYWAVYGGENRYDLSNLPRDYEELDNKSYEEFENVSVEKISAVIAELNNRLNKDEANVLILRFGLETGERKTLEEVAKLYNVSRERVLRLEMKALRKLRFGELLPNLKD